MNEQHKTPWISIILAVLAIIAFIACSPRQSGYIEMMAGSYGVGNNSQTVPPTMSASSMMNDMPMPSSMARPDYYGGGEVSVTDTREFLKKDYYASMRTRDVVALAGRAETTIRGYGGRIDRSSSSEKNAYIQFVVPVSKFDDFRNEIEALVGSRFITVQISSQNLLPQKQSIEEQQKQADTTLADYRAARVRIVNAHASTLQSLQVDLDRAVAASAESSTIASIQSQIARENSSYQTRLANADANIKFATDWQKAVQTQDKALLDNVMTVGGTVNIQWISLWDIARLYLPGYSIPAILADLSLLSYLWERNLWIFRRSTALR